MCGNDFNFELPEELLTAFRDGSVVIFAGAGVSTETPAAFADSFYDTINAELPSHARDAAFPDTMQAYEDKFSRTALLTQLKNRLDYAYSFPELYRVASQFHQELSTIPSIRDIVTTNFDALFEEVCLATAVVEPTDYAFWNLPQRRVLKIHGSINNLGSLVLTRHDYEKCYRRLKNGPLGATLQHILATRPVLFIGYSLSDDDFNRLYKLLRRKMGAIAPKAYIVTLSKELDSDVGATATPIRTDASFFLRTVKQRLVGDGSMFPDERFEVLWDCYDRVTDANLSMYDRYSVHDYPTVVIAASYQNGVQHGIGRMQRRKGSGEYSSPHMEVHRVDRYLAAFTHHRRNRNWIDAAYCEGYANALMLPLLETKRQRANLPLYFAFGAPELRTARQFRAALMKAEQLHKTSWRWATRWASGVPLGMVFRHTPFVEVP